MTTHPTTEATPSKAATPSSSTTGRSASSIGRPAAATSPPPGRTSSTSSAPSTSTTPPSSTMPPTPTDPCRPSNTATSSNSPTPSSTPSETPSVPSTLRGSDSAATAELIGYCGAHGAHCVCSRPPGHDGPHCCTDRTLWEGCFTDPGTPRGHDVTEVLAVDPGPTESAWVLIESETCRPIRHGKLKNDDLLDDLFADVVAIEMVASYGMAVGREVFETCVWIGRFIQACWKPPELVYRLDVKLHHCGSARAKDANITQALIDRFASGEPNRGKGTKKAPGWFYGFHSDIWAAYALAVYVADRGMP